MHRSLSLAAATIAVFAGVTAVSGVPTAEAFSPLTGQLVDAVTTGHPGVPGMVVRMRELASDGSPGAVVDEAATGTKGFFSLDAGPTPTDEYYVQVIAGNFQGGYVGGGSAGEPNRVEPTAGQARTYGPHATIGAIRANPAFIRGIVVDAADQAKPVAGVLVTGRDSVDISAVEGADTTNANGVFKIQGLTCEDSCYLKVNGSSQSYETGFSDCSQQIVPTWGAACASPIGRIGKVFLDKL